MVHCNICVALHHPACYMSRLDGGGVRLRGTRRPLSRRHGSITGADPSDATRLPEGTQAMTDVIETAKETARSKKAAAAAFDMPKFELQKFEIPKMEIPTAFREIAEKSVSQAKETYEKMKSAAEDATDILEDTYATATKGASDYGLKIIELARENTNAAFDFATQLMTVKSLSEMVELSTAHSRKQFETLATQSKELAAIAQKVATDSAEPVKESFGKVFKKVA